MNKGLSKKKQQQAIAVDLVTRILNGDKSAEKELILQYHRSLLYILNRKDKHSIHIEDLAQDTWVIVIEKIRAGKIKHPKQLSTFILQTGKYLQVMSFRREERLRSDSKVILELLPDSAQNPQIEIDKKLNAKIIRKLINDLYPPRDREMLLRFYIHDESIDLICKDLELSNVHFHRVLYRARKRFKKLWDLYQQENENK